MGFWDDAEVVSTYTREQALEDGVLIDVSETAKEAGFKVPVAITAAVWVDVNDIPPSKRGIQDVDGRLWDLLWMGHFYAKAAQRDTAEFVYPFYMDVGRTRLYHAKMHIGPGDDGEPVVTVMLPEEG